MKLGTSLKRRRGSVYNLFRPSFGERLATRGGRLAAMGFLITVGGLGFGYLFATRVLFPAPPPPGDLQVVPDLRGMMAEEVGGALVEVGLMPGSVELVRHPSADSAAVIGQSPLPGQLARPGSEVMFSLSLGPERRAIPDVEGVREDWARSLLEAAGFSLVADSVEAPEPRGTVLALQPEAGTEIALPAEVRLTVSLGPAKVSMPRVLGLDREEAIDTLEALGLTVAEVQRRFGFGRPGVVTRQEPPANSLLDVGSSVRLTVGAGRRR